MNLVERDLPLPLFDVWDPVVSGEPVQEAIRQPCPAPEFFSSSTTTESPDLRTVSQHWK